MPDVRGTAPPPSGKGPAACPAASAALALAIALAGAGAGALATAWLIRQAMRGTAAAPGAAAGGPGRGEARPDDENPGVGAEGGAARPGGMSADEALRRLRAAEATMFDELGLSAQERCIGRHVMRGLTYREIAERAYLAERTVKYHARSIYAKARVDNRRAFEAYVRATLDASPGGGGTGDPTARI